MKYYIVAGEPSGDMYGAQLMSRLKILDNNASFRFWGGDKMEQEGGEQVSHIRDRSFMGIWEVLVNIPILIRLFKLFKKDVSHFRPDLVIFIDYPGFNLRVAPYVKSLGIPVHYYIAPKVWAWNTGRVKVIKKNVDYLYSILPFEPLFFQKHKINTHYVGNPIIDIIQAFKPDALVLQHLRAIQKPIIALLPGSRIMELKHMMPIMAKLVPLFPECHFVIAAADAFPEKLTLDMQQRYNIEVVRGKTYELLSMAKAAVVASGTATLETALFNTPQVVCYKFSPISYHIVKRIIKVKYISLVNLIMDKPLLKELIQYDFTLENTQKALHSILYKNDRELIHRGYAALKIKVGGPGAVDRTAELIYERGAKKHIK